MRKTVTFVQYVVLKLPVLVKNNFYILLLLLFSLFATSCIDEIDLRTGNEKSSLVLESFLSPSSTNYAAFLSTSVIINSRNQMFEFPEDAIVTLEEKVIGGDQSVLTYANDLYLGNDIVLEEGKTYELSASVPNSDFEIVFGETTIPQAIEILDVALLEKVENEELVNGEIGNKYVFSITIDEPTVSPTYFHLYPSAEIFREDGEWPDSLFSVSKGLEPFENFSFELGGGNACHDIEHLGGILINHSKLENNQIMVTFYTNSTFEAGTHIIDDVNFELRTVEESYYNYHLASSKQIRAQESVGGQPVASFSNVTNGFGVVSSYNSSSELISVR